MGVLKARVAGAWIPLGVGTDEVYVGTAVPTDPGIELWYDPGAVAAPGLFPAGRNLFDNGQMAVNQRGGASVALTSAPTYLADRWSCSDSGIGAANLFYGTVAAFAGTFPAGRPRPGNVQYVGMISGEAAGSLAAGDYMSWQQGIEGRMLQHLNWGTADAKPLVLSFDVFSTVAATVVVEMYRTETASRSISRLVTVPAGYSTQTVTVPGDTTTLVTNDNAARLTLVVWMGAGSTFTSGALRTSWGALVNANRCAGISNTIGATVDNLFAVTNCQLEIGLVASPYEVRRYDDELQACMRCFQRLSSSNWYGFMYNTTAGYMQTVLPVVMRAAPTLAIAAGPYTNWVNDLFVANLTPTSFAVSSTDVAFASVTFSGTAAVTTRDAVRGGWPLGSVDLSAEI